jgi:imidazole glycerol phosphate synthase subunit HisF
MFKRIIGLVLVDNGIVCRTRNFVSDYLYTDAFIDTNLFDEIVFIDVTKTGRLKMALFVFELSFYMWACQKVCQIEGGITFIFLDIFN